MKNKELSQRRFLKAATALSLGAYLVPLKAQETVAPLETLEQYIPKGLLKQSSARFIVNRFGLEKAMTVCKRIGLHGIDLLDPDDWDAMLKNDLVVTMGRAPGHKGSGNGFNRVENHDLLIEVYSKWIPVAAEKKVPNLICFSGNRQGIGEEEGMQNCIKGFKRIAPIAEKHGVTLCMELFNEKDPRIIRQAARRGQRKFVVRSAANESSCFTTFITCNVWKGNSSTQSGRTMT